MPLLGFSVFKEKVLDGSKAQTIRKMRKYPIEQKDKLFLYWHTRRPDCEKLGETICSEVFVVRIFSEIGQTPVMFRYCGLGRANESSSWNRLSDSEVLEIAQKDGFIGLDAFFDWFISHYGSGETYQVIRWPPLPLPKTCLTCSIENKLGCWKAENGNCNLLKTEERVAVKLR